MEIITKVCTTCHDDKALEEFNANKLGKFGRRSQCKKCDKIYNATKAEIRNERARAKYQLEREQRLKKQKDFRDSHKDEINAKNRLEYPQKRDKKLKATKKWQKENREKCRAADKRYAEKHPEKIRIKRNNYYHKNKTNPRFAIRKRLSTRINDIFRYKDIRKSENTAKMLGCSIDDFIKHLESLCYVRKIDNVMMTKEHFYTKEVHIDHEIPVWKFNLLDSEQRARCFHYTNLRPLWYEDHRIKTNQDVKEYHSWKRSGLPLEIYLDPEKREKSLNPYNTWL